MTASFDYYDNFQTSASRDVAALVLGDRLGYGSTRVIFKHATDPDLIVKVEDGAHSFCNIAEWSIWDRVKDTDLAKWFAPVVNISPTGIVIVMKRCDPIRLDELPARIPAFFTDIKV